MNLLEDLSMIEKQTGVLETVASDAWLRVKQTLGQLGAFNNLNKDKTFNEAMIVTPHKESDYYSCVFPRATIKHWKEEALCYAQEVMESLWDQVELNGECVVKIEYRNLKQEELNLFLAQEEDTEDTQ